ncbi:ATP-binding protein [Yinghuangia sp. ASG 101]|uniref:sensor histidine kinase n=1 Tax=Yinghuangia sp. ASG 101 TaxID=2896848 RepID=UPI001E470CFA|nr:ATP-binding protein [Yinghuangia sp. ASG 101]UGQ09133.1 ATP-binding protein [Yinghuangia sp. ASG 101]
MKARVRPTIRLRLTAVYGVLVLATGALLLGLTYVLAVHALPYLGVEPPPKPDLTFPPQPPQAPRPPTPGAHNTADGRQFLIASGVALAGMTAVSVGLGWVLAGRMLRPLRTMSATARAISAADLHRRLAVPGGPDDEVTDLARTFDGLLERLEVSFEAQRRFVANASHELRTPLTFERSLLEVALADPDASAAELRDVCRRALANNAHQEQVIEALLTLARSERGLDGRCEDVDVAVSARTVLATMETGALRVDADLRPAPTRGDPRLIERLVTNLVDNAVRHNVPHGTVHIHTGRQDGRATLRVTNSGPTVPPGELDRLFQPFQRLDATRTAGVGGVGLGLAIVAAIATAHRAELVTVARPQGGLDVRVTFA